jgi:sugar/nucleoside kinase (ribokinase family)
MCEIWTMGEMLVEIMRPRAGMQLYEPGEFMGPFPSGAPAIFIDTVARLGHTAGIFGGVGKDDFGKNILDRLRKDGVNVAYVMEDPDQSTAVAFVTYFADGSRKFIYHIGNTPAVRPKDFAMEDIGQPKYFHIMGSSLMADEAFRDRIIDTAVRFAETGAKISFDPNIRPELLGGRRVDEVLGPVLDNCAVLMPGIEELKMLTGEAAIEGAIEKIFAYDMMEVVALKKGGRGSTLYSRYEQVDCPLYDVPQVDPTGAGDCYDAALLCGLLEGLSLREAGRMASAAGALNVMKLGPMEGEISRENIQRLMDAQA